MLAPRPLTETEKRITCCCTAAREIDILETILKQAENFDVAAVDVVVIVLKLIAHGKILLFIK